MGMIWTAYYTNQIPNAQATFCQSTAIPAYFYPGAYWDQATNNSIVPGIMIMNPASGSGVSSDPNYVTDVNSAKAKGIKIYGYVDSNYGSRPANEMQTEIQNYKTWYNVTNIFLDQTPSAPTALAYYQSIVDFAHSNTVGSKVMFNPGVFPDEQYVSVADILVVHENTYAGYLSVSVPSWVYNYPASKFYHIVHTTSLAELPNALSLAHNRNAGYVYVTDDSGVNPYDQLPSYWDTEINSVAQTCIVPPSIPSSSPSSSPTASTAPTSTANKPTTTIATPISNAPTEQDNSTDTQTPDKSVENPISTPQQSTANNVVPNKKIKILRIVSLSLISISAFLSILLLVWITKPNAIKRISLKLYNFLH